MGAIASQQAAGTCCDWGKVAGEAAVGAVSGAITGLLGPAGGAVATVLVHAAVGAAVGAGSQAASNLIEGKPLGDGVLLSAVVGGVTGGVSGALVARQAAKLAGAGARVAKVCALSFSPETAVATPAGAKAIGALQEGDQVEAYDPATGAASVQTVEHVWINHDGDLIDLTLRADDAGASADEASERKQRQAAVSAHGAHAPSAASENRQGGEGDTSAANAETIHTTAKHPWLTADRGWVPAGELRPGERVVQLDGTTATVAAVRSVPGAATMYNLQVSVLHTFAVGVDQYVVHNKCDSGPLRRALGGKPNDGMQAQHLIPCECQDEPLVKLARQAGWDMNGKANGLLVRDKPNLRPGQMWHWGSHPRYMRLVRTLLTQRYDRLKQAGQLTPDNAYKSVTRTAAYFRQYIIQGRGKIR